MRGKVFIKHVGGYDPEQESSAGTSRREVSALRSELAALLAERERTNTLVAASKAFFEACMATAEAFSAWGRTDTPASSASAWQKYKDAQSVERDALWVLSKAASAMHADGGAK